MSDLFACPCGATVTHAEALPPMRCHYCTCLNCGAPLDADFYEHIDNKGVIRRYHRPYTCEFSEVL